MLNLSTIAGLSVYAAGISEPELTNHLLIECVDMYMMLKEGVNVEAHFRSVCRRYGAVQIVRVFQDPEAVAVSLDTPEKAYMAR